ncbi:hypothetical protein BHM03_00023887 [Ensete ventricosum]|nr:hypothetical protein BHM03_00023887 [Ensete ventricosum]
MAALPTSGPLCGRHRCCPCVGSGCPCSSAVALPRGDHSYDRHPCWRQGWPRGAVPYGHPTAGPLAGAALPAAAAPVGWPQPVVPTGMAPGDYNPCGRSPPCWGPWPRPGRGWPALHGGWPWVAGPAWGLAVAGRPFSSLQKRSKNA